MRYTPLFVLAFVLHTPVLDAAITVEGDLSQAAVVVPGTTQEGIILLRNLGATSSEVRVYQTDYVFFADGRSLYGKPSENPRSNAAWIFIQPTRLTVAPKSTAPVNYTIKVPDNKTMTGTYWSIIMIEEIPAASKESAGQKKGVGLTAIMRYGIQIITEIGDTGTNALRFPDKQLVVADGKKMFQIDIENTGERWYRPDLWIEVYDMNGKQTGRFEGEKKRLFPGCSVRHMFDISTLPAGKYKFLVFADTGNENIYGAEYSLELR